MSESVKRVLIAFGMLFFCLLVMGTVSSLVKSGIKSQGAKAESSTTSSEPTYMGITKADYLEVVGNNGQDTAAICAYTYLIDTYGLEATAKMDQRADKNPDDIDPAIYEAIERCM